MQVDNQTLSVIVKNAVQTSITPDYIGWTIAIAGVIVGITAIVITILIYKKQTKISEEQTKLSNEYERVRKEAVSDSLKRMRQSLFFCKDAIHREMKIVDMSKGTDEDKIATAREIMKNVRESRIYFADNLVKEADFVHLDIKPELYANIQGIANDIRTFVNDEILSAGFGDSKSTLGVWMTYGNTIIHSAEEIISKITFNT